MALLLFAIYFTCTSATNSPTSAPSLTPSLASTTTDAPTAFPSTEPTLYSSFVPTRQPTSAPTTSSPSFAPSIAPTLLPTSAPSNTVAPTTPINYAVLPAGFFQTACLPAGSSTWQRGIMEITSPPSPGQSNGFQYTNQLFLTAGCAAYDAQVVSKASHIEAISLSSNEANLNVYVTNVTVTVANALLIGFAFGSCDGGGWQVNVPRLLNHSCVVAGVAIPAPAECPVYYSKIHFNTTTLKISDLYTLANKTNITCSEAKRATNITSGDFMLHVNSSDNGGATSATCETISNASICAPFIDYPISVPSCTNSCSTVQCQKLMLEKQLFVAVLPQIWSVLTSSTCRASIGRLLCGTTYGRCGPTKQSLCFDACNLTSTCSTEEQTTFNQLLSLLNTTSSSLCAPSSSSTTACSSPPALPSPPLPGLENSLPQSASKPTPAVSYPTCAQYDGKACAGLVNFPVYIPDKNTLFTMEQAFEQQVWFAFGLANQGACFEAFTRMACATVFNRCDRTAMDAVLPPGSVPIPLPRLPCRSMCDAYNNSCAAFIALAPGTLARDCLGRDNSAIACDNVTAGKYITTPTGTEHYPINQTVLQSQIGLQTYCNVIDENTMSSSSVQAAYVCPYPLLVPDNPTSDRVNDGHCALPCDAKYKIPWATAGWNSFFSACLVFSFLSSLWTITTYVVFRERLLRSQTQIYAFHTILAVFLSSIIPLPVVFVDPTTAITYSTCKDNTREMTIYDPYCATTGILMIFLTKTTGFFFTAFVLDLYLVVSMRNQRFTPEFRAKMAKWTFIGIYGYSIAFTIMAVAVKKIRNNNLPFCFVFDWVSDMFWIVMCGSLIVDCVLFFGVCRIIFASYRKTAQIASKETKTRSLASQYRRPIIFTAGCCLLFCIAIVARLQARIRSNQYKILDNEWFLCTVIGSRVSGQQCAQYPPNVQPSFLFITEMVIFLQGFIISSIFGFSGQNARLWRDFMLTRVFPKISCLAGFAASRSHGSSQHNDSSIRDSSASVRSLNMPPVATTRDPSNRSRKNLRDLAREQSQVPMAETPRSVNLSTTSSSSSNMMNFQTANSNGDFLAMVPHALSSSNSNGVSPTPPESPRSIATTEEDDSPKSPPKTKAPRKVKKPKPLSRALFVPASSKTEFVPFD